MNASSGSGLCPIRTSRDSITARSLAQVVQGLVNRFSNAGDDRSVAKGEAASLGLPKRHDEIHKVARLVALKRHHELLVVEAEGVGGIELDRWKLMADLDVNVHHLLSPLDRQQEPVPGLHEWIDKQVAVLTGDDRCPPSLLAWVDMLVHIDRALGHGHKGVR